MTNILKCPSFEEFFRQHRDEQWDALVLGWARQDLCLATLLITELGVENTVRVDHDTHAGDIVTVSVVDANPATGRLRFSVVASTAGGYWEAHCTG